MSSKIIIIIVFVLVLALLAVSFVVFSQINAEIQGTANVGSGAGADQDTASPPSGETDANGSTSGDHATQVPVTPASVIKNISYKDSVNDIFLEFETSDNILTLNVGTYGGFVYRDEEDPETGKVSSSLFEIDELVTIGAENEINVLDPYAVMVAGGELGTMTVPPGYHFIFCYVVPGEKDDRGNAVYHFVDGGANCPISVSIVDEYGVSVSMVSSLYRYGTEMEYTVSFGFAEGTELPRIFKLYCLLGGFVFPDNATPENLFSCKAGTYGGLNLEWADTNFTSDNGFVLDENKYFDVVNTYAENKILFNNTNSGWVSDPLGNLSAGYDVQLKFYYREFRSDGTLKPGFHLVDGSSYVIYIYDGASDTEGWKSLENGIYVAHGQCGSKIKIGLAAGFKPNESAIALYCFDIYAADFPEGY